MKYDIPTIHQAIQAGKETDFLFFWGHRRDKNGGVGKGCFSQWWEQKFIVDGITYSSAEHWMMAGKAKLFKDEEMWEKIIQSDSPAAAKKLGRKVRNFQEHAWIENRYEIVREGNWHKFSQSEVLKGVLLGTKEKVLVEASPYDRIWGIGLSANAEGIEHPKNWQGLNLLGFALMEVRDQLRSES